MKISMRRRGTLLCCVIALLGVALLPSSVSADEAPAVMLVQGHFATLSTSCPETPSCAVDRLTGDLDGTNTLTLLSCQPSVCTTAPETASLIAYHDHAVVVSQFGTFAGDEHGTIKPLSGGQLNAVDNLTSTDGCGSQLFLHNQGVIDVTTFIDSGTYTGVLVLRPC
jgi:hypothetical protein